MRTAGGIAVGFLGAITLAADPVEGTAVPPKESTPAVVTDSNTRSWTASVSTFGYLVPDGQSYGQPTVVADVGRLHLEARYNYEGLETGSLWVGYNLHFGERLTLDLTPMVGGVVGDVRGVAPGVEATLSWWKLEGYWEMEYVASAAGRDDSFLYLWSEVSLSVLDWLRVGGAAQRTSVYETEVDIQRGFLVGLQFDPVAFTTYVFNPAQARPTLVMALEVSF
ncbi:MAG: hypothetical protein JNL10_06470 [Verrucomicrobiales bacterium]|nr:hypothetical protein [Verrucomicrobiales bacterium]